MWQTIKINPAHLNERGYTHEQIEEHIERVILLGKIVINSWKQANSSNLKL